MSVVSDLTFKVEAREVISGDLGDTVKNHLWSVLLGVESGTTATKADRVWSDTRSAAASADTIDLLGTLTDASGTTISFVDVLLFAIKNKSTTATENLTVGAGSNNWSTWAGASGHQVVIPPGGAFVWFAGTVDDEQPTAGTGDILTIDPGSDTISYDIIVLGRSS